VPAGKDERCSTECASCERADEARTRSRRSRCPALQNVGGPDHPDDGQELLTEPPARDGRPVHEFAQLLHQPKTPRFDRLAQLGVIERIGHGDGLTCLPDEGDPGQKDATVILDQQVATSSDSFGGDASDDLRDERVDRGAVHRERDRHTMMTVEHEMHRTDAVHLYRRHRLAPPLRRSKALPPLPDPSRRRSEEPVEVSSAIDTADDGIDTNDLHTQLAFTDFAERSDHLVERQDRVDVVGLATQPADETRHIGTPTLTGEVVLGVGCGESCVTCHGVASRWSVL
jgi:hypothetical protein